MFLSMVAGMALDPHPDAQGNCNYCKSHTGLCARRFAVVRPVSDHTQLKLDKEGLDVIRAIKVSPGYSTRMPLTSIAVMRGRRRSLPYKTDSKCSLCRGR